MITPAQHQANRQNAQKSTGPRTEEGKQRSSQNALRHGLTVTDESLILKNSEELSLLIAAHSETYTPRNEAEHTLVRQLSLATIRLRRVELAEEQLWEEDRPNLDRIGKFDRYRASAERAFHRNYNALEKLRKERSKSNPKPEAKQPEPIQQIKPEPPQQNEPGFEAALESYLRQPPSQEALDAVLGGLSLRNPYLKGGSR